MKQSDLGKSLDPSMHVLVMKKMQFQHLDLDLATQKNYWSMRIHIPNIGPQLGLDSIGPMVCSLENEVREPFSTCSPDDCCISFI